MLDILAPPRALSRWLSRTWIQRATFFSALLVLLGGLIVMYPNIQTDPGEIAVWMTSLVWQMWTGYASVVNWGIWYDLRGPDEHHLKAIALRRVRNQAFQTAIAGTVWIAATITLFLPISEAQGAIRTYSMVVAAVMFCYRSVLDHMEQRSVDTQGVEVEPRIGRVQP